MRKIKFRAWHTIEHKMIYGADLIYVTWFDEFGELRSLVPVTLMQSTGLKDKNGTEIYEGDIIRWHDIVTSDYPVTFTDAVFCIDDNPENNFYHHRDDINTKWEVIGNIYKNKNLLE